jgi:membrane associated rhomboid family serine protease
MDTVRAFFGSAMFGTRFLPLFLIAIYFCQVAFLDSSSTSFFTFCPRLIIEHGQVWRFITATVIHDNLFHLVRDATVFTLMAFCFEPNLESVVGTLSFFYHFFLVGAVSGVIHTVIAYLSSLRSNPTRSASRGFYLCFLWLTSKSIFDPTGASSGQDSSSIGPISFSLPHSSSMTVICASSSPLSSSC